MKDLMTNPKSEESVSTLLPVGTSEFGFLSGFGLRISAFVLFLLSGGAALSQTYSLDWFTIDGGGGTSAGSVYTVRGTIGQPAASATTLTGGAFSLTGGFWTAVAIQTPGAPTLSIVPAGSGQARVSWTPDASGWLLQETPSLAPASWSNSPSGATNPALVPTGPPMRLYRLFKP